ncbi:MAG: oxidoreductase [Bacteroidetes bacterium]|nr:MAG: oxidoreductase [Bacteroidota bacterium]
MDKLFCFIILLLTFPSSLFSQEIHLLSHRDSLSIRGLSVVDDNVIWVSGTNGTVGKSLDGGKTWHWMTVKNFEKRDFRDIEAFDRYTAIVMAVAEPAQIIKTNDGGKNWKVVLSDSTHGMFLDAMDFLGDSIGIVVGDPIDNQVYIAFTRNQGDKWIVELNGPTLKSGEALFAASGTNTKLFWDQKRKISDFLFVSGGLHSRLINDDQAIDIPIIQGKQTAGANSLAIDPSTSRGIIVGGDYANDSASASNCVLISLNGDKIQWSSPAAGPRGYKSCVEFLDSKRLIACGTSGVDVSQDGGNTWKQISNQGFHVCRKAKNGQLTVLAGANGRIARLKW